MITSNKKVNSKKQPQPQSQPPARGTPAPVPKKAQTIKLGDGRLGKNHAGRWRREAAEAKAQRIIERELKREGWNEAELTKRAKTDPVKTALAARIREETTVTIQWLASRLQMGTRQTLNAALYRRRNEHEQVNSTV